MASRWAAWASESTRASEREHTERPRAFRTGLRGESVSCERLSFLCESLRIVERIVKSALDLIETGFDRAVRRTNSGGRRWRDEGSEEFLERSGDGGGAGG